VHHVDGSGGGGVLGGVAHRRASVDQPRVSDVRDRGQIRRTPGGAAVAARQRRGKGARRSCDSAARGAVEEKGVGAEGVWGKRDAPLRPYTPTPLLQIKLR